ncbi:MAG: hypothetical protein ABIR68_16390 [Ilumatobacteraceae bacterium]
MTVDVLFDEVPITDAELEAEALAADADAPLDPDAVPFDPNPGDASLLPSWYMPMPRRVRRSRRTRIIVALIVLAILVVNGVGLCVTYGHLEIPI